MWVAVEAPGIATCDIAKVVHRMWSGLSEDRKKKYEVTCYILHMNLLFCVVNPCKLPQPLIWMVAMGTIGASLGWLRCRHEISSPLPAKPLLKLLK